jgi:hypothetical protein
MGDFKKSFTTNTDRKRENRMYGDEKIRVR